MSTHRKPVIVLTFQSNGKNGGPYISHKRIMNSQLKDKYEFVPLYLPRMRELLKPWVFRRIVKEIRAANPDLFQFTGLQIEGFIYMKLGIASGVSTICAIRGSTDEAINVAPLVRIISNWCEKKTLNKSDVCYAVSEYVASWHKTKTYAHNLYGVIYNFYDFTSYSNKKENRERIRKELAILDDDIVVVSTGRIIFEKGFGTVKKIILAEAYRKKLIFVIAGDGNYCKELKNAVHSEHLEGQVRLLGFREDINAILDASDIFLSCTLHETFGNSILEGSYHGLPVIASRVGGVPEIIDDGKTGMLIEPNDTKGFINKLDMLIDNEELRFEMGNNGIRYIRDKFDDSIISDKLDKLYQGVLGR